VIKYVSVVTVLLIFSSILVASTHIVEADSADSIRFSSGAVIFSPLNRTYNSRFLTLNLTFGVGLGVECSLNYSIDGKYEGPIPLVAKNPTEMHVINEAIGYVTLPELSEGSHRLTVYVLCGIYDYHGANPPSAPFTPTSPGSTDYVASWAHTIYSPLTHNSKKTQSTSELMELLREQIRFNKTETCIHSPTKLLINPLLWKKITSWLTGQATLLKEMKR
jgi:hypothetical protein